MFDWYIVAAIGVVLFVAFVCVMNDYQRRKRVGEGDEELKRSAQRAQTWKERKP